MPFKNQKGGWRTKRNFGFVAGVEVPPFNVPLGDEVSTEAEAIEVENVLDNLPSYGEHGATLLLDVAHKRRTPHNVYTLWHGQEIRNVAALTQEDSLSAAFAKYLATSKRKNGNPLTNVTRYSHGFHIRALLKLHPDAKVRELPALLTMYKEKCRADGTHQAYRRTRSTCLAFARSTEKDGQFSALWREIAKVGPLPKKRSSKEGSALPVWEVVAICQALPDERMRNVAFGLAFSGMRVGEYANNFEVTEDRIVINGTKTDAARRFAPLTVQFTPEAFWKNNGPEVSRNNHKPDAVKPLGYDNLRIALKKASAGKMTPHTFRHCYSMWCLEAGIPRTAIAQYLGWSVESETQHVDKMLALYGRTDDLSVLERHTEMLVSYIKANWTKPKATTERKKIERLKVA